MSIAQHTKPDSINQNEMDTSSTNPDIFPRLIIALVSCAAVCNLPQCLSRYYPCATKQKPDLRPNCPSPCILHFAYDDSDDDDVVAHAESYQSFLLLGDRIIFKFQMVKK